MRRSVAFVVTAALLLPGLQASVQAAGVERQRLAGADRFATAAVVSEAAFPQGADTALLARGDVFADALAAGALAGTLGAPVLLSRSDGVPDATLAALDALGVSDVILLGGTGALGSAVERQLTAAGLTADRVAGATRYATAAAIARRVGADQIGTVNGRRTALLASGANFPDALAAGPLSYAARLPILLTPPDRLAPETANAIAELGIEQVFVLGGSAAVSNAVQAALGVPSQRLQGADRTRTAAAVAGFAVAALGFSNDEVVLARGDAFPDALASAPYAGERRGPLLLIPTPNAVGAGAREYLAAAGEDVGRLTALGGPAAVSNQVLDEAEAILRGELPVDERVLFGRGHERTSPPFGVSDVFLREADGTVRRITNALADPEADEFGQFGYRTPAWAPDGTQFAAGKVEGSTHGVAAVRMDGRERWSIHDAWNPVWSPDGRFVAFAGTAGRGGGLWTIRADGTGEVRRIPGFIASASWSPDSRQFAYVEADDADRWVVAVSNLDGSGRRTLPRPPAGEPMHVAWSPDGTELAVVLDGRFGGMEIALIRADGQGGYRTLVSSATVPNLHFLDGASWRADGQALAFSMLVLGQDESPAVYRVNRDGTGVTRLVRDGGPPAYRWPG